VDALAEVVELEARIEELRADKQRLEERAQRLRRRPGVRRGLSLALVAAALAAGLVGVRMGRRHAQPAPVLEVRPVVGLAMAIDHACRQGAGADCLGLPGRALMGLDDFEHACLLEDWERCREVVSQLAALGGFGEGVQEGAAAARWVLFSQLVREHDAAGGARVP
jgi:hypothetical protein